MESGRVSPPLYSSLCADEIQENFPQIAETFWILWFPMLAALWQSQLLEMGCSALCSLAQISVTLAKPYPSKDHGSDLCVLNQTQLKFVGLGL